MERHLTQVAIRVAIATRSVITITQNAAFADLFAPFESSLCSVAIGDMPSTAGSQFLHWLVVIIAARIS